MLSDCKGNKEALRANCDYYKKPTVFNPKALAEENAKLKDEIAHLKRELEICKHFGKWRPTVGKWDDYDGVMVPHVYECDQCLYDWDGTKPPPYCPDCGSIMSIGEWEDDQ